MAEQNTPTYAELIAGVMPQQAATKEALVEASEYAALMEPFPISGRGVTELEKERIAHTALKRTLKVRKARLRERGMLKKAI